MVLEVRKRQWVGGCAVGANTNDDEGSMQGRVWEWNKQDRHRAKRRKHEFGKGSNSGLLLRGLCY